MSGPNEAHNNMEKAFDHIDAYMKFMYNLWTEPMCHSMFGDQLGGHIWNKWMNFREDQGIEAAIFNMWFALDHECIDKITNTALIHYSK